MAIRQTLTDLGLIREETTRLFKVGTRDNSELKVFKDEVSGLIFIDNFYIGDDEYHTGNYRETVHKISLKSSSVHDFVRFSDCKRRVNSLRQFYIGKSIADFGCGHGDFLRRVRNLTVSCIGIELQEDFRDSLNQEGIKCFRGISEIPNKSLDSVFLFHTFEHLEDPLEKLNEIRPKLKKGGKIILEVPHANDFLISHLSLDEFINFTLWSQHLILHTRESIECFLKRSNFCNIIIKGVQRYGISNHLNWLANRRPGGHESNLSFFEDENLKSAYESALTGIDATDSLLIIADSYK